MPISWLIHSVCPPVWEWYTVDNILLVPNAFMKSSINLDANWGPLSLRMVLGTPCNFYISFQYIFAISLDETFVVVASRRIIFVNQSTMTMMTSFPFDFSNGPMILILISFHGSSGIFREYYSPTFFICCTLFCWHLKHPWTYFLTSVLISNHQ